MINIKTNWRGISLEAPTKKHIDFIKSNIRKLKKENNIVINPLYFSKIRLGKTDKKSYGEFYSASRMIKLDPFKDWTDVGTSFSSIIVHEYIHAIDLHYEYVISRLFFEEYIKALNLVCQISGNEELKVFKHDLITKKEVQFLNYAPISCSALSQGKYNDILFDYGYGYDYCLTNPEEFAAVTMEIFCENPESLNFELQLLCNHVKQFFLIN